MLYVLAANYQHYIYWCKISGLNPNDWSKVRYVHDMRTLQGVSGQNCEFIFYETCIDHPNYIDLHEQVEYLKRVSIPVPSRKKDRMFTWLFWKQALERCIRAFASSLLALTGADVFNVVSTNWGDKLPIALSAMMISLLMSLIGATGISGTKGDPSLVETK